MIDIKYLIFFFGFLSLIASCTEVINVPLGSHTPKLVIEGEVSDISDTAYVRLTISKEFSNNNDNMPHVIADSVIISDQLGNRNVLSHLNGSKHGLYTTILRGIPGNTYFLEVVYQGHRYHAQSKMPNRVEIDSVFTWNVFGAKPEERILALRIKDPVGEENYYKYFNSIDPNFEVLDDKLINGARFSFNTGRSFVIVGDTVKGYVYSIDRDNFNYLKVLLENSTRQNTQSAAPDNPKSNIIGGAYGYFSAHSVSVREFIVK